MYHVLRSGQFRNGRRKNEPQYKRSDYVLGDCLNVALSHVLAFTRSLLSHAGAFLGFADGGRKRGPKGRDTRPVGPRAGVGFFGREQPAPPHQLGGLGSAVSSPSGVRRRASAAKRFYYILSTQDGLS